MKKLIGLITAIVLLLGMASISHGADLKLPESSYEFYVYDESGVIGDSLKREIIDVNRSLNRETGTQIVVAVVKSTEGSSGAQEYANELFEKWKIGDSEKDNGVLMLVSMEERELWIEIGYGLEGALPDGKVGGIRDKYILPYFKEDSYEEGIRNGFYALVEEVSNEYNITDLDVEKPLESQSTNRSNSVVKAFGAIGLVILVILDMIFFRGMITMTLLRIFLSGRGGSGRGGSGRGSGGGGSSGGGGAGGRW